MPRHRNVLFHMLFKVVLCDLKQVRQRSWRHKQLFWVLRCGETVKVAPLS